jgi:hypothetical protein
MTAYKTVAGMLSDQYKDKFTAESVKNHWRKFKSLCDRAKVEPEAPLDTPATPRASPRRPRAAVFMLRNSYHHMEGLLEEPYMCRGGWTRDEGNAGQWDAPQPASASRNRQTASRHRRYRRHQNTVQDHADILDSIRESSDMMSATLSHEHLRRKALFLAAYAVVLAVVAVVENQQESEYDDE